MNDLTRIELEFNDLEKKRNWIDKFNGIKQPFGIYSDAVHPSNLMYNRYTDIFPFNGSRVKLQNMKNTDYINANFVECKEANRKYILCQGPLRNTCEHFWQMIWEQNTKAVIMLNRLVENDKPKCEEYYPNIDNQNNVLKKFGKFRLCHLSEQVFEDFVIRSIKCENIQQKETREMFHIHYTNWPDFGEPETPNSLLKLLDECERLDLFNNELYGRCVVHCSAGVGRSGTFILIDSMIQLYKKYGNSIPFSVSKLLEHFREYRMGLVQTEDQLRFAYSAIIHSIQRLRNKNSDLASSSTLINYSQSNEIIMNECPDRGSDGDDEYQKKNNGAKTAPSTKTQYTAKRVKRVNFSDTNLVKCH